jgi:hypothetical protein
MHIPSTNDERGCFWMVRKLGLKLNAQSKAELLQMLGATVNPELMPKSLRELLEKVQAPTAEAASEVAEEVQEMVEQVVETIGEEIVEDMNLEEADT